MLIRRCAFYKVWVQEHTTLCFNLYPDCLAHVRLSITLHVKHVMHFVSMIVWFVLQEWLYSWRSLMLVFLCIRIDKKSTHFYSPKGYAKHIQWGSNYCSSYSISIRKRTLKNKGHRSSVILPGFFPRKVLFPDVRTDGTDGNQKGPLIFFM